MCRGVSAVEVSCAALGSGQLSQGPHSAPPQGYPCKTWNLGLTEEEGGGPEPKKKMERGVAILTWSTIKLQLRRLMCLFVRHLNTNMN